MGNIDTGAQNISRREFLKMAGMAGAGAAWPRFGEPDPRKSEPLPPREKLTDADLFNMALPITSRLEVLSRRGDAGFGIKTDVVREPGFMDGDSLGKWERNFPSYPLEHIRNGLQSLDPRWILPKQLSFFAYPQLNYSYQIPFNSYPVKLDQQTGRLVPAGPIQEVYKRGQQFLPDEAVTLWGGRGFIGEMWEFKTLEHHNFGSLGVVWWAKRGIPFIDSAFSLNTSTDLMASVSRKSPPEFFYSDNVGNQFAVSGSEDVLFIPIGLKMDPSNAPNTRPEFNA
ncbi:twin-arginine translocation signal domain-containing protein [Candidatus Collierbacteria bacterium]|nr:twin-arginine translocation signal domain-containing protein [Candidatus Collierbacteria bacterium]